ncbi:hypothetical protein ABZ615_25540 [Streptomyces sp. NPDC007325]|uniref:hypothetical protein n=1 Tax=Streptomyces sp. NPDC007325 TaxID=3154588 RepID=UPI003410FB92
MISTAGELLAALAPLPHAARLRCTAVTAHRLAARGLLRPVLDELDALGPYERRLGRSPTRTASSRRSASWARTAGSSPDSSPSPSPTPQADA